MTVVTTRVDAPSLRINVVANYAGRLWGIASVYVFVPVYIRILGIDAYGLIAFYSVALAILFVADAGLSSSFAREAARERDPGRLLDLLFSIECLLFAAVGATGLCMLLGAPLIAGHWLNNSSALSAKVTTDCVRLMSMALVPQIAMALYLGGLMGLQRQVRANILSVSFSVVRSGLVVLPIYVWKDPRVFFLWQAVASWVFLLLMRTTLRQNLGAAKIGSGSFSLVTLRPVLGYAMGMLAMSVIAGVNTQLDRLVVSKLRPLEEFTYYSLAATLSQIPMIVTLPIALALLPRLTVLREQAQYTSLRALYELNTYLIAACSSAAAFALFFFADDVLALWMHGTTIPAFVVPVVQVLSIGGLFLALQLTPFQLSLANGHNRTNVRLGAAVLVVTVPMQVVLTSRFGLQGAAVPWLALNTFAFFFLGVVLNRRFNEGHTRTWFLECTLPPVLISAALLFAARRLALALDYSAAGACALAAIFCVLALACALALWLAMKRRPNHV